VLQSAHVDVPLLRSEHAFVGSVFFGSNKQEARLSFETGSPWVSVTSQLCTHCEIPQGFYCAHSETCNETFDKRRIAYQEAGWTFDTIIFSDDICMAADDDFCVKKQEFYAIYEEEGLLPGTQGVFGMSPLDPHGTRNESHDSVIHNLADQGNIWRSVAAMFISPDESKLSSSIQIGDFDYDYCDGEDNLNWHSLFKPDKWHVELTDSYFGSLTLFTHYFSPAEMNAGFEGVGIPTDAFNQIRDVILQKDADWFCNTHHCLS
jgi:hypothetical protein